MADSTSVAERLGYATLSEAREELDAVQQQSSQSNRAPHEASLSSSSSATTPPMDFGKPRSLSTKLRSKYDDCLACLPSDQTIDILLATFFTEVEWYFTIIDRPYFQLCRRAWTEEYAQSNKTQSLALADKKRVFDSEGSPAELLYFPAVLLQVLALALQFLPSHSPLRQLLDVRSLPASDRLSRVYSDAGAEVVSLLGRHNSTTSAILADLLRCAWLKNTGRGNEAWFSLGDAVR